MTLLDNKQCHQVRKAFIAFLLDDIACWQKENYFEVQKGSSEFYTLTEKGEELADLMRADEEDSRILINDLKLIGIEPAFMQKSIVRAVRSKASLVETLRERETLEQKMNVLRQTPLDDSRVIPRYICSKLIDHFVPWSVFGDLDNTSIMMFLTLDCFFESLNMNLW